MPKIKSNDADDAENKDVQPDLMPEVDDDAEPAAHAAAAETDEADAPRARKPADQESADDDPRARAVRRYREIRDQEEADAKAKASASQEPDVELNSEPGDADPTDAEDNANETPETPAEKPKTFKLKVNGKIEEHSLDEVISLAQIAKAGDSKLTEAKGLATELRQELAEVRKLRETLKPEHQPDTTSQRATQPDPSQGQSDPEHQPAKGLDPAKLRQITERIQVGDTEDGVQALSELVEDIVSRASGPKVDPAQFEERVSHVLTQRQTQAEIDTALGTFAKNYPDIVQDELLLDAGKSAIRRELIKDMQEAGIDEGTIDSMKEDIGTLAKAHRNLRSAGKVTRSYAELLEGTGKLLTERFGLKRPATQSSDKTAPQRPASDPAKVQERVDRKRAAPQQPRAVGMRQQVAAPPQPRSARDIVAAMRAQRRFPSTR